MDEDLDCLSAALWAVRCRKYARTHWRSPHVSYLTDEALTCIRDFLRAEHHYKAAISRLPWETAQEVSGAREPYISMPLVVPHRYILPPGA